MIRVAVHAEDGVFDAQLCSRLLGMALGRPLKTEPRDRGTLGKDGVIKTAAAFLQWASSKNISRAVLMVDNDGGKGRKEHVEPGACSDKCPECLLCEAASAWRRQDSNNLAAVMVPVQTVETWLACLAGYPFAGQPEGSYDRVMLKRLVYGKGNLPVEQRLRIAQDLLGKANALAVLRQRPSFQRFEKRLAGW